MKASAERRSLKSAVFSRLLIVLSVCFVWALVILVRLVILQGFKAEEFRLQSDGQQWGFVELSPKRGDILDRHLEGLAISIRADSIYAHPHQVKDPISSAQKLEAVLGVPSDMLLRKLTSKSPFVYLKRKIPPREAEQALELGLEGIAVQEETKRIYPNKELASHVLGFVGMDNIGLGGLEYRYEKELSGQKGRIDLRFDARRNSFQRRPSQNETDGNILVLTLDRTIQHFTENILRETVLEKEALSGSAIVMEPDTGAILAMASYPNFNPNSYQEYAEHTRRNRAILDFYEPGSTFKMITLSAILNEGLSDPEEVIDCRPGTARLGGKIYREAKTSFGFLSLSDVIAKSSNIGTIKLAIRLGEDRLHDYAENFGFGTQTKIDLPGEEGGLFRPVSQWSRLSIGAVSIGQEIGVTPLQMIRAGAAIANGGYLVNPYLVQRVLSPDGKVIFERGQERRPILKPETTQTVREILEHVVVTGTGRTAQPRGYSAAGKTGTAQKIVDGHYSHSKYVASFLGFAPASKPAVVVLIVVDEPKGIPWGGHVAGPAFKEIMERTLIRLKVPQDRRDETPDPTWKMASITEESNEVFRTVEDSPSSGSFPLEGFQEAVLSVLGDSEAQAAGQGQVTVKLNSRTLPDFKGSTLREVAQECARLDLQLKITGSGVAVGQRPEPGSKVSKGTVCEVFFSAEGYRRNASSTIALRDSNQGTGRSKSRQ